jgi:hypothetical protein
VEYLVSLDVNKIFDKVLVISPKTGISVFKWLIDTAWEMALMAPDRTHATLHSFLEIL